MDDEIDARRVSKVARALARSKNISDKTTRSLVGHTMKLHASNSVELLHNNRKTSYNTSIDDIDSSQSLSISWAGFASNKENPLSQSAPHFSTVLVDEEAKSFFVNPSIVMDDSIGTGSLRSRVSSHRSSRAPTPQYREESPLPFFRPDINNINTQQLESSSLFDISTAGSSRLVRSPELTSAQSQVEIDGNYLPANYFKENMIQVLRKHDLISRSPVAAAAAGRVLHVSKVKKGEYAFNDSVASSSTVDAPTAAPIAEQQPPSVDNTTKRRTGVKSPIRAHKTGPRILPPIHPKRIITPADVNASASYRSLLSSTYRSKINSIVHIEDDYAAKWMRMKDKRDVIRTHEEKKMEGKELEHFFRRLQINMEKHEKQQMLLGENNVTQAELEQRRQSVLDRHHQHEELYVKRKERLLVQKNQEAREFKNAINKSIKDAQRLQRHDNHSRRSLLLDEPSFELDDATSTMIEIPHEMNDRLRTAKSLLSYQAAKKEIKDYHDSIFLQRLSRLSESKERARQRTEAFRKPLLIFLFILLVIYTVLAVYY